MHILSPDRTVCELHQYFTLIHASLDKCAATKHFAEPVDEILEQLTKSRNVLVELEDRHLGMRARMTVCIFYLRKAIISLGKEIRKTELSIRNVKIYEDFLPMPSPPTQVPIHQQMQSFIDISEHALKSFGKIPQDPRCESIRAQKIPLQTILKKSRDLMKEYNEFFRKLENARNNYKNIQQASHEVIRSLQKELLQQFEYNTSDVTQYFLTLAL